MSGSQVTAQVRSYFVLLRVLFKKRVLHMKRYWVNFVGQITVMVLMFTAIFFGGQQFGGPSFGDSLGSIVVGFFLWSMGVNSYTSIAQGLMGEARMGTLEQLFLTPFGFGRLNATKILINLTMAFLWGGLILAFMLVLTGEALYFDVVTLVPLIVLTLLAPIGIGFAMAGLAMLYKQVSSLFQLIQFAFLGFIALPMDGSLVISLLPFTLGSDMLMAAMEQNRHLLEFSTKSLAILCLQGIGYLLIGYFVFVYCIQVAKERGVIGHY